MDFKEFFEKNRDIAQLSYGIILIVLIPVLIVFNSFFIIRNYNRSIDEVLQRQALMMGLTISRLMASDLPWDYFIQAKLDMLLKDNSEILDLAVLLPEKQSFKILASANKKNVLKSADSYYYKLAWLQPLGSGLATASENLSQYDTGSSTNEQNNFWLVAMPMSDSSGEKTALLTVKLSSEIVNHLTTASRNISLFILVGTIFIVVLILLINIRLWDYVLLYRKSKALDNMKNEFISMVSHELRTPVTGIRGHSAMILDGSLGEISEKAKNSISMIKGAADRLASLVEDLLDVSRIEQGRMPFALSRKNIYNCVKSTVEEMSAQAKAKKLFLEFKPYKEDLPYVNVDLERLKQILVNLIGNAIKYTEKGGVEVVIDQSAGGKVLEIKIKDTGIGMASKDRGRLFEKFYRIQNDKTKKITGTGLGLWITKRLVELMNGRIVIESIEDVGTQATVKFLTVN